MLTAVEKTTMRILIAEDELILAYAMRAQLKQRGLEVVGLATNGRQVFDHCQRLQPDIVFMDVRMPEVDGIEGVRLIMQHCPTCIIMITAFADEATKARAEAAGAMGFLSKPVQAGGVLEEVPRARARFTEFETMQDQCSSLEEALCMRKSVEDAKTKLMKLQRINATEAFKMLRERAAATGLSLKAAAEQITEE
jgi:two-component system, response regulator PdtaR